MDIHSNLEYLCRVCAANTKGRNSVAECVYILKTAGLKDKLDKFLYLKISENDSLPKVLCKSCFRQVEATASLSKIAKHTQQVFRDFLLSNLPKGPSEITNTSEFTSSDFMGNKNATEKSKKNETMVPPSFELPAPPSYELPAPPPPTPTPLMLPPLLQPLTTLSRKDEVVVNVSVADPLTRDNQQKMISNSQRRQSLLVESRFTPKSIAQKQATTSAAAPRQIAPKLTQPPEINNIMNNPTISTPTLSFYPSKTETQTNQQHTPQATQVKTLSSGGYVINRLNTASTSFKEDSKKHLLPLKPSADNILQQKRKNLVKALNNIKANNTGQVSLLKSSQQKQVESSSVIQNIKSAPSNDADHAVDYDLPNKLIIAAPKAKSLMEKSKKEPLNLSSKASSTTSIPSITTIFQQTQEKTHNSLPSTPPKSAFPDDILLGRVIRDVDLLKLILKALKWPFNKRNLELQLQRLKSTKFTDIMSDPNLLQDTDLTQLLGPYLAPVLLATQALQQQQQQILKAPLDVQSLQTNFVTPPKMTALEAAQAEINKSIPYKLPPETSVQLVPATPEETETTQTLSTVSNTSSLFATLKRDNQETPTAGRPVKRQRKNAGQKSRDSIVISDEEDVSQPTKKSKQRAAKSAPNLHFDLTSNILTQFNLLNGSYGGNEAEELMALLLKQNAAFTKEKKMQRRRRNSVSNLVALPPSEFDALIDLDDDIVLMEPVSTTTSSSEASSSNQELQQQQQQQQQQQHQLQQPQTDATNTFVIPSAPVITRPIIKRRKTVIHPPKNMFDISMELKSKDQGQVSLLKSKEKLMEETINQVATGVVTNVERPVEQQTPAAKAVNTECAIVTPTPEAPAVKTPHQKKMQNKSTLGQQLLEAIGLQETPSKVTKTSKNEASSSKTIPKPVMQPGNKPSIQQIRTALKRSLQQAQEQEQQKKRELSSSFKKTVIQDADSTTKPGIKEILVVEGKGNKSENSSCIVDVEDQIDKVTLMVRKNDKNACEQSTTKANTTSVANEREEKKELKKSPGAKIQERRRTLLVSGTRAVGARNVADKEKSNDEERQEKMVENVADDADENVKLETEGSVIASVVDEVVAPKKRGRKRLIDKPNEPEVVDAIDEEPETITNIKNEEENESNKTSGRPTRQSKTQSKYYKGPEKIIQNRRFLPSRTTRNRKYC